MRSVHLGPSLFEAKRCAGGCKARKHRFRRGWRKEARMGEAGERPERLIERGHHDMGGLPAGKVELAEHDYMEWERRVDALMVLLCGVRGGKALMTVDELRKNIEAIGPEAYDRMSYYERWITSITHTMIQRGVITTDQLARKLEELRARQEEAWRR